MLVARLYVDSIQFSIQQRITVSVVSTNVYVRCKNKHTQSTQSLSVKKNEEEKSRIRKENKSEKKKLNIVQMRVINESFNEK